MTNTKELVIPTKPTVYILHSNDAMGFASAAIALNTLSCSKKNFIYKVILDTQSFPELSLTKTDEVYILNLSFDNSILDEVKEKIFKLHNLNKHSPDKSAVLLAWKYFVPEYPPTEAVSLLNLYHNYISDSITIPQNKLKEVISFNLACSSMMEDFSFWTSLMNGYFIDSKLWKLGYELYDKFLTTIEEIKELATTEFREIKEKRFCFIFANTATSLIAKTILEDKELLVDGVVCIFTNEKELWEFKLLTKNDLKFCVHDFVNNFGGASMESKGYPLNTFTEEIPNYPTEVVDILVKKFSNVTFK